MLTSRASQSRRFERPRLENLLTELQRLTERVAAAAIDVARGPDPVDAIALVGAASDLSEQLAAVAEADISLAQELTNLLALYPTFLESRARLADLRQDQERRTSELQALRANVVNSEQGFSKFSIA